MNSWRLKSFLAPCLALVSLCAGVKAVAHIWVDQNTEQALKQLPYAPNIYPAYGLPTPAHGLEGGLEELWNKGWSDNQ